mgnify:CR=1 FL=1
MFIDIYPCTSQAQIRHWSSIWQTWLAFTLLQFGESCGQMPDSFFNCPTCSWWSVLGCLNPKPVQISLTRWSVAWYLQVSSPYAHYDTPHLHDNPSLGSCRSNILHPHPWSHNSHHYGHISLPLLCYREGFWRAFHFLFPSSSMLIEWIIRSRHQSMVSLVG